MSEPATLSGFTVYMNPSDYPGKYVVRRWTATKGKVVPDIEPTAVTEITPVELEAIRESFRDKGMVCILRMPDDDQVIIETWM